MFVFLCSFTKKEKWQCFRTLCHATFHHALIVCCYVSQVGYIAECITFGLHLILVKAM